MLLYNIGVHFMDLDFSIIKKTNNNYLKSPKLEFASVIKY
jgi:hypothetical protein